MEHRNTVVHAGSALPYSPYLLLQELSWTYGLCLSAGLLNISVSLPPGSMPAEWPLFMSAPGSDSGYAAMSLNLPCKQQVVCPPLRCLPACTAQV